MHLLSFFSVLLTIIASFQNYPTAASTISHPLNVIKPVQAFQNIITPSPTTIPSITPTIQPTPATEKIIDCIGVDGKHLFVTQKACDDFNNAWKNSNQNPTSPWGTAQQIGEHTYSINVGRDDRMATPQEVLAALNNHRQKNGRNLLNWDDALASYAQSRATTFSQNQTLDAHSGFDNFLHNQDGFKKLGFNHIGENAAYAGPLSGVHLIEWVFAADNEHNTNQLSPEWQYAGIGINGIATDIVFASNKR